MESKTPSLLSPYLPQSLLADIDLENHLTDSETPPSPKPREIPQNLPQNPNLLSDDTFLTSPFPQIDYNLPFYPNHPLNQTTNFLFNSRHTQHPSSFFTPSHQYNNFLQNYPPNISDILLSFEGSQQFQKYVSIAPKEKISQLLIIISNRMSEIMCNCYGNYLMQKIIKLSDISQRIFILKNIKKDFILICKNVSGTHCIQILIDKICSKEEEKIVQSYIKNNLLELTLHQNSTHIIQKLLNKVFDIKRNYLLKFVLSNFIALSSKLNGAIVVKKFISEISLSETNVINLIISFIEKDFMIMCHEQYANYIVQYAFEHFGFDICERIILLVIENILVLSIDKYASNVVDKVIVILKRNNQMHFERVIKFLFFSKENLGKLLSSKYGQFVLINIIKEMNIQCRAAVKNSIVFFYGLNDKKCAKVLNYL